ncbi:MAG: hypothetical protein WD357_05910 [Gracilimonas sp.]
MAWTFEQFENMSTDELKNEYDKRYSDEIESRDFILNEISRKKTDRQTQKIVTLTKTVKNLTWAIFLLTIINLILVGINVF